MMQRRAESIDKSLPAALCRCMSGGRMSLRVQPVVLCACALAMLGAALPSHADGVALDAEVLRVAALEADIDFGEYLAAECAGCHMPGGGSTVPAIHGIERDRIVRALLEFQRGVRDNDTMRIVADSLLDEDIAALALYLSGEES